MTDEQLQAIRERAERATPGPWHSRRDGNQYIGTGYMPTARCVAASRIPEIVRPWNPHAMLAFGLDAKGHEVARFLDADADFVAHAREDVPALLAEVERLRREVVLRDSQCRTPHPTRGDLFCTLPAFHTRQGRPHSCPPAGDGMHAGPEQWEDQTQALQQQVKVLREACAEGAAALRYWREQGSPPLLVEQTTQVLEDLAKDGQS